MLETLHRKNTLHLFNLLFLALPELFLSVHCF